MKDILKYIIPIVIVAIAFIAGTNETQSVNSRNSDGDYPVKDISFILDNTRDYSELKSELCPTRIQSNITLRQNSSKRANNTLRNNFEFDEQDKIINSFFRLFITKTSQTQQTSFTTSSQRLISFGKLLI